MLMERSQVLKNLMDALSCRDVIVLRQLLPLQGINWR